MQPPLQLIRITALHLPPPNMTTATRTRAPSVAWSALEDALLLDLTGRFGVTDWCLIASAMETRTARQCRERYKNHVKPNLRIGLCRAPQRPPPRARRRAPCAMCRTSCAERRGHASSVARDRAARPRWRAHTSWVGPASCGPGVRACEAAGRGLVRARAQSSRGRCVACGRWGAACCSVPRASSAPSRAVLANRRRPLPLEAGCMPWSRRPLTPHAVRAMSRSVHTRGGQNHLPEPRAPRQQVDRDCKAAAWSLGQRGQEPLELVPAASSASFGGTPGTQASLSQKGDGQDFGRPYVTCLFRSARRVHRRRRESRISCSSPTKPSFRDGCSLSDHATMPTMGHAGSASLAVDSGTICTDSACIQRPVHSAIPNAPDRNRACTHARPADASARPV